MMVKVHRTDGLKSPLRFDYQVQVPLQVVCVCFHIRVRKFLKNNKFIKTITSIEESAKLTFVASSHSKSIITRIIADCLVRFGRDLITGTSPSIFWTIGTIRTVIAIQC